MAEVVVVGGYGRLGSLCVRELLATTKAEIVIAGRNVQRAESSALARGERATSRYVDAGDLRTLPETFAGASAIVACCAGAPLAALDLALRARVPFVSLVPFRLDPRSLSGLAERAWEAQVPVVLSAGAAPGLAGVAAEWLLRRFDRLDEICIACTGPWTETPSAQRDLTTLRAQWKPELQRSRRARSRWFFPEPIGWRLVRARPSLDLEGFAAAHCVERVTYLERDDRLLARGVDRVLQRERRPSFVLVAEAFREHYSSKPEARLTLEAPDVPSAAAASAGVLVGALLAGLVPAGLLDPREAVNPGRYLDSLSQRGVRVIR